ncbi:uncharacterized protein [Porites lutea]|uniref:uncharacterized protein n=1 Tax=Porites lutea TaxID=51062 RepID=UPI003CC50DEB
MKFLGVTVFVALISLGGVNCSDSVAVNTNNLQVSCSVPIEDVWTDLSRVHRYPVIKSGDQIVLRLAHSSYSSYLLYCLTSYCELSQCSGSQSMTKSLWSSCSSYSMFYITAFGRVNGEPINSGDTVSLSSAGYGFSYRLRCYTSSTTYCRVSSITSTITGNEWLYYSYATFEIYAKNAVDGTPVQYGDVVGLKYPYYASSYWMTYYSGYFRPRSCSSYSKTSCAKENTFSGFRIFKRL